MPSGSCSRVYSSTQLQDYHNAGSTHLEIDLKTTFELAVVTLDPGCAGGDVKGSRLGSLSGIGGGHWEYSGSIKT